MQYTHLLTLATLLGSHVGRSDMTVAKWCGVHARLFNRLRAGEGCRVDTFNKALKAFSDIWPEDLEWPREIARPAKSTKEKAA
ncbi:hypothetical protein JI664_22220 [Rhodobacter sp. NTK016B]|uniref:hypothetical protein n=1 Tax=Rhodobacter sp. NTK016B TaxID=2759676 RepID=UPI001A905BA2|nr:hypothetical protein [Rhodobacter sp. NTK016B]MBN8294703.1 hypothetical protein [Rhodobacter sp. NTK016B]